MRICKVKGKQVGDMFMEELKKLESRTEEKLYENAVRDEAKSRWKHAARDRLNKNERH